MRVRFKSGCVWKRGNIWYFRAGRKGKATPIGTTEEFPTETKARIAAQPLVYLANSEESLPEITLGFVVARYRAEKMPKRASTARGYKLWLKNYVEPKWQDTPLSKIHAEGVELWLHSLELSQKTKREIKGLIRRLLDSAMFWRMIPVGRNPMELIRIKKAKTTNKARTITVEEFQALIKALEEPFRTMACICQFHGLRVSEMLGLKWKDVDWFKNSLRIERSVVNQVEDDVKTEHSAASLPLEDEEIQMLKAWRAASEFTEDENFIFASPHSAGEKPYHYTGFLWKLEGAAKKAGIPRITTHTFRHTYRAWGGVSGIPVSLMKDLMRHSDIRTTMNTYGSPVEGEVRKAHKKIMQMVKSA
jgi:integrase